MLHTSRLLQPWNIILNSLTTKFQKTNRLCSSIRIVTLSMHICMDSYNIIKHRLSTDYKTKCAFMYPVAITHGELSRK